MLIIHQEYAVLIMATITIAMEQHWNRGDSGQSVYRTLPWNDAVNAGISMSQFQISTLSQIPYQPTPKTQLN